MKYVITGGAGHISQPLAETLLQAGHQVTVIGRSAEKLEELTNKGATAALGSIEDVAFLTGAFAGADAVYLMLPPNYAVPDLRVFQNEVSKKYVEAIKANNIKHVVMLSSIGAHMGNGAGPVDGLSDLEKLLNELTDVNVKFLRPSYFMYNLLNQVGLVKHMQVMGGNFAAGDEKLALVHTKDIAAAAAEELLNLNFTGKTVRYIAGDEKTGSEIAKTIGVAIGKPDLRWVEFTDEQSFDGMKQAGLPDYFAQTYTDMGEALRKGLMQEDYWKNRPQLSAIKLEDFTGEFVAAYNAAN